MERHFSPNPGSRRPRQLALRVCLRALCVALAGCSAAQAPAVEPARPARESPLAAQSAPPAPAPPSCPRLARAKSTYTGFAVDVPSEAMHLALDVLVPIQDALGALFCGPERAPCRPAALLSVELADASAQLARVQLDSGAGAAPGVLQLRALGEAWQAEPESLAAWMAACQATQR